MIYIYGLVCPITGEIRYIGKSTNPEKRLSMHISAAVRGDYDHHTARWIRKLHAEGLRPRLTMLQIVPRGQRWQDIERRAIKEALAAGMRLTNSTGGGEGLDYLDPEATAALRRKQGAAMKALWNDPDKKEFFLERIGSGRTPDVEKKRLESSRIATGRPEFKIKMSRVNKEINSRPEVKEKRSRAMKAHWEREEYRGTIVAARNDPNFTEQQAERLRKRWADPEGREKIMTSLWSDEKRRKQAERLADPERQAKIAARRMDPEVRAERSALTAAMWKKRGAKQGEAIKAALSRPETKKRLSESTKALWQNPEFRAKQAAGLRAMWARRKAAKAEQT